MASNIHSHQHLMGPALMAAAGPTLKFMGLRCKWSSHTSDFPL